jgi:hypothetical protein
MMGAAGAVAGAVASTLPLLFSLSLFKQPLARQLPLQLTKQHAHVHCSRTHKDKDNLSPPHFRTDDLTTAGWLCIISTVQRKMRAANKNNDERLFFSGLLIVMVPDFRFFFENNKFSGNTKFKFCSLYVIPTDMDRRLCVLCLSTTYGILTLFYGLIDMQSPGETLHSPYILIIVVIYGVETQKLLLLSCYSLHQPQTPLDRERERDDDDEDDDNTR